MPYKFVIAAGHSKLYDNRLDTHQPYDYRTGISKLDVHQRNTYNRTNHNRYHAQSGSSSSTTDHPYRQSSSGTTTTSLLPPQVVVHGIQPTQSASSSAAPPPATAAAAYADNNNHSQYSALHNLHNQLSRYAQEQPDPYWDDTADSRRFTERRKKTVRFDGQDSDDWTRWDAERQGSQDSATKDSGIDTSSTFTSSEDSNRGDGPKVPNVFFFFLLHFYL